MRTCSSSWVLVMALWLVSPGQCAWAAGPEGQRTHWQAGWAAAPEGQAGNEEAGFNWRSAFTKHTVLGLALTGSGVYFIDKASTFTAKQTPFTVATWMPSIPTR